MRATGVPSAKPLSKDPSTRTRSKMVVAKPIDAVGNAYRFPSCLCAWALLVIRFLNNAWLRPMEGFQSSQALWRFDSLTCTVIGFKFPFRPASSYLKCTAMVAALRWRLTLNWPKSLAHQSRRDGNRCRAGVSKPSVSDSTSLTVDDHGFAPHQLTFEVYK